MNNAADPRYINSESSRQKLKDFSKNCTCPRRYFCEIKLVMSNILRPNLKQGNVSKRKVICDAVLYFRSITINKR